MFTSRAEYRLSLRADNADERLTPLGRELSLVKDERWSHYLRRKGEIDRLKSHLETLKLTPSKAAGYGWKVNQDGRARTALEYLSHPGIHYSDLVNIWPELAQASGDLVRRMEAEALYAGYLPRQAEDAEAMRRDEAVGIPEGFDFEGVGGLSNEVRSRLLAARPQTIGAAARLEGVTPGALTALLAALRSRRRLQA